MLFIDLLIVKLMLDGGALPNTDKMDFCREVLKK